MHTQPRTSMTYGIYPQHSEGQSEHVIGSTGVKAVARALSQAVARPVSGTNCLIAYAASHERLSEGGSLHCGVLLRSLERSHTTRPVVVSRTARRMST